MSMREVAQRLIERSQAEYWRLRYFRGMRHPKISPVKPEFRSGLARAGVGEAPVMARERLVRVADRLLAGEWPVFAVHRCDVAAEVDWHVDARHRTRAPQYAYALSSGSGRSHPSLDMKYVWELSRHHHTTSLAMAYYLTGDERYAHGAVEQIGSWINHNPFLRGAHWSSGIEIGMRLIAFTWVRRLLADWPHAPGWFEENEEFRRCVFLHQWVLAHRRSHSSSANNHLLYELAGLYVSTCAMPWHTRSDLWRSQCMQRLRREFPRQLFPSGYSRELASDYNGFVLEALVLCLVEEQVSGRDVGSELRECAARMFACLEQIADIRTEPPRQGDSDNGSGLLLDAPDCDRWRDLRDLGRAWACNTSSPPQSLRAWLLGQHGPTLKFPLEQDRPVWSDAGLVLLRSRRAREIFCAFDAGPLGFLSIAAHGHADALAVELRYGGQPVLVDPGTYAYSGPWREYFRSTAAHNTIELGGTSQSTSAGPFLWSRHAHARVLCTEGLGEDGVLARAAAEHDGYLHQEFAGKHLREVSLDRVSESLTIRDRIGVTCPTRCRMFFHLHPDIGCSLQDNHAELDCAGESITMKLPDDLAWRAVHGSDAPRAGWYSPAYDVKVPTTTLIGEVVLDGEISLQTVVTFPSDQR